MGILSRIPARGQVTRYAEKSFLKVGAFKRAGLIRAERRAGRGASSVPGSGGSDMKKSGVRLTPGGLLALLASGLYVVLAITYISTGSYFTRSPDSDFASANYQPEEVVLDPTGIPPRKGSRTAPVDLSKVAPSTPDSVARGKKLFAANCTACHGDDGKGDGPAAKGLAPAPRDFTSPDKWVNGYGVAAIFGTLSEGIKGSAMGAYDTLSVKDRFDLAHYVQSLGKFPHGAVTRADLARLDERFHLSDGADEPNKAPVSRVMANMAAEYESAGGARFDVRTLEASQRHIYEKAVLNPVLAARTLARLTGWRKNPAVLAEGVSSGAPGNGFSPAAATFSEREWRLFHDALVKLSQGH